MALIKADRVKESSTSAGASTFLLNGAFTGFRAFSSVCSVGDTFYYVIDSDLGSEWETGLGTYSAVNTLTRTTVYSSSNGGSIVAFSAGTKNVYISLTGQQLGTLATLTGSEVLTNKTINASNNTITNVSLTTGVTGTLPLGNGGTGTTTAQLAINSLAGAVTSGSYLRGNGTNVVMASIAAGDVPTLNQNTTGTASGSVSGTASYVPKFTSTNVVGNSQIFDNGTNVGIGTTSPSDKLHVIGNFRAGNYTYGYLAMTGDLPGYANGVYPTLKSDQTIYFSADGKYSAYLGDASKNVFGLLHPTAGTANVLLNPNGTSYFTGGAIAVGATQPAGNIKVYVTTTGSTVMGLVVRGAAAQSANLQEWQNSAGTALASIDSAGNLISGTINSGAINSGAINSGNLTISHGNNLKITLNRTGSFPYNLIQFTDLNGSCYVNGGGEGLLISGHAANKRVIQIQGLASQTANLQEWQNNSGTALAAVNPSGSLLLKASSVLASGYGYLDSGATAAGVITLYGGSGEMDFNVTGAFPMTFRTTGTERMRILSGGNVGIGTASPGAQLHVTSAAAATKGMIVRGAAAQSANLQEWQNNAGSVLSAVKSDGSIQPASLADSAATNNSIYYSTTASKLVYKDAAGTVNNLY